MCVCVVWRLWVCCVTPWLCVRCVTPSVCVRCVTESECVVWRRVCVGCVTESAYVVWRRVRWLCDRKCECCVTPCVFVVWQKVSVLCDAVCVWVVWQKVRVLCDTVCVRYVTESECVVWCRVRTLVCCMTLCLCGVLWQKVSVLCDAVCVCVVWPRVNVLCDAIYVSARCVTGSKCVVWRLLCVCALCDVGGCVRMINCVWFTKHTPWHVRNSQLSITSPPLHVVQVSDVQHIPTFHACKRMYCRNRNDLYKTVV